MVVCILAHLQTENGIASLFPYFLEMNLPDSLQIHCPETQLVMKDGSTVVLLLLTLEVRFKSNLRKKVCGNMSTPSLRETPYVQPEGLHRDQMNINEQKKKK